MPIVQRELRVASRQARTWWRRGLMFMATLMVLTFMWLETGTWSTPTALGRNLFMAITFLGLTYGLLAGPMTSVDCLARERREGTLGLLFLTDLHSYDIVLGKAFAATLDLVLGLLVILPLAAIPLLLGGVTLSHYVLVVLSVVNLLFLSVAVGTLGSSLFASVRAALAFTLLLLGFLLFGVPWIAADMFNVSINGRSASYIYALSPFYTYYQCMSGMVFGTKASIWTNFWAMHAFGWLCIGLACLRTRTAWRQAPGSGWGDRLLAFFARQSSSYWKQRSSHRNRLLSRNPIGWLESRDRLQKKALWAVYICTTAIWLGYHFVNPQRWPEEETVIMWALFGHWIFCGWLSIQAPRRLADDKRSGALELLLCTPLRDREVVAGLMQGLRKRFLGVLLALMALHIYAAWYWFFVRRQRPFSSIVKDELFQVAVCGLIVIPFQAYSFARVGIYQGLAVGNSLRATWQLVFKLGVLPWVLFLMCVFTLVAIQRSMSFRLRIDDWVFFATWAAVHLGVCSVFLAIANWHLARNLRRIAAQPARVSIFARLGRLLGLIAAKSG